MDDMQIVLCFFEGSRVPNLGPVWSSRKLVVIKCLRRKLSGYRQDKSSYSKVFVISFSKVRSFERTISNLDYSIDGVAGETSAATGTRPMKGRILLIPTPMVHSAESWEEGRNSTCGVLCNAYGKDIPHCSRSSRRLIRRRVLARCAGSCGSGSARLGFDILLVLIDVMVRINKRNMVSNYIVW